jgi:hypothetical protein
MRLKKFDKLLVEIPRLGASVPTVFIKNRRQGPTLNFS